MSLRTTSGSLRALSRMALLSVSCAALSCAAAQAQPGSELPAIQVTAPEGRQHARSTPAAHAVRSGQRRRAVAARQVEPQAAPAAAAFAQSQDARTGTVGVYANSTSAATKTNTALVNIPQSLTVVTKETIRDQNFQSLTEVTRYVPGVAIHQGEGNRDELVIRGVDSSANFF